VREVSLYKNIEADELWLVVMCQYSILGQLVACNIGVLIQYIVPAAVLLVLVSAHLYYE